MRVLLFFFFFLLMVNVVFATSCESYGLNVSDCSLLEKDNLGALLDHDVSNFPNHELVNKHNSEIVISTKPLTTLSNGGSWISDAWIEIMSISSSLIFENQTYVPKNIDLRVEYDYDVLLPGDVEFEDEEDGETCYLEYELFSNGVDLSVLQNNQVVSYDKISNLEIHEDSLIIAKLNIISVIEEHEYRWNKQCSSKDCVYVCEYERTKILSDSLSISDEITLYLHKDSNNSSFLIFQEYKDTFVGVMNNSNTNTHLFTNHSYYEDTNWLFIPRYQHSPYDFLYLEAITTNNTKYSNLKVSDEKFYLPTSDYCVVESIGWFENNTQPCIKDIEELEEKEVIRTSFSPNWKTILGLIVLFVVILLLFRLGKKVFKKIMILPLFLLLFSPLVSAESCGLSNLASCIPQKIFDFSLEMINSPLQILLDLTKGLLETPVSTELFIELWAIIIYVLSMFYGFLLLYAGLQFITSGHDVLKREMAKEWLKNTIIMIILIQSSYFIYELIINLSSVMTTSLLSIVETQFFLLSVDNISNVALEFLFSTAYVITLLITILFLIMRYLTVALGVILFPIGIFCYFIPPLRTYGKLIINILLINIFITFMATIIVLASTKMLNIRFFTNMKILVMINCFAIINTLFIILTKHTINKSTIGEAGKKIASAAKYIAMIV